MAPGLTTYRLKGKTAQLADMSAEGSESELTVILDGGTMLKVAGTISGDELKKIGEALPIEAIEQYLKG